MINKEILINGSKLPSSMSLRLVGSRIWNGIMHSKKITCFKGIKLW